MHRPNLLVAGFVSLIGMVSSESANGKPDLEAAWPSPLKPWLRPWDRRFVEANSNSR